MAIQGLSCTVVITWEAFLMYVRLLRRIAENIDIDLSDGLCSGLCKVIPSEPFQILEANIKPSGGPAGVVYGYLFVWLGTLAVFATLAEASSM